MNTAMPVRKNYQLLDAWRGVAALWVVMFHTLAPWGEHTGLIYIKLLQPVMLMGGQGVHVFFVISGYCIANAACSCLRRNTGFLVFMKARVRRIYPPMWVASALSFALAGVVYLLAISGHWRTGAVVQKNVLHQGFAYYVANLTLTQIALRQKFVLDVCWTLCYEVTFYLIVGLAIWGVARGKNQRLLLNLLHAVTLFALLGLIFAPAYAWYPFDFWPEFGLGVLAYDVIQHPLQRRPKLYLVGVSLLVLVFLALRGNYIGYNNVVGREPYSIALVFAWLICGLYPQDEALIAYPLVRWLAWVGSFSYSLYITHLMPLTLIQQIFKMIKPLRDQSVLLLIVCFIVSTVFARLFYHFCELPFLGNSTSLKGKDRND